MRYTCVILAITVSGICLLGCGQATETSAKPAITAEHEGPVDDRKVVARVDGYPITVDDVRKVVDEKAGEISKEEALEALINRELLANEARRRGWEADPVVQTARRKAMARAILSERIDKEVNFDTLDKEKLRRYYEVTKERFVHGLQRRVSHILVKTGKKGLPDEEARQVAADVANRAADITSKVAFHALGKTIQDEQNAIEGPRGVVSYEEIPPFAADNKKFAKPFVDAAFSVPTVGRVSREFKSKFGWHVIFVEEEIPAINQSYEEVEQQLVDEVLPQEKILKSSKLVDELHKAGDVFVFEDRLSALIEKQ